MTNPKIISKSVGTKIDEEGCLSFPDIYGKVRRYNEINIEYQNLNGALIKKKFNGQKAKIFQHELDHLDKVLFIDRLGKKDLRDNEKNKKLLNKLIIEYEETNDKESMKL
jgi:peptide deformylase